MILIGSEVADERILAVQKCLDECLPWEIMILIGSEVPDERILPLRKCLDECLPWEYMQG